MKGLPLSILKLVNLQQLNLYGNEIDQIPGFLLQFKNLKHLDFGTNSLMSIPNWIGELKSLEYLDLSQNSFRYKDDVSLPVSMIKLTQLETLHLWKTGISVIPDWFSQLKKLKYLNLSNNIISEISSTFKDLDNLEELVLIDTRFKEFPQIIYDLKSLKKLSFTGSRYNQFKFPEKKNNSIRELILDNITSFSYDKGEGSALKNIENLKGVEILEIKSFGWGELTGGIGDLESLKKLIITGVSHDLNFPLSFGNLSNLEELIIGTGSNVKFPESFGKLEKIKKIDIVNLLLFYKEPNLIVEYLL